MYNNFYYNPSIAGSNYIDPMVSSGILPLPAVAMVKGNYYSRNNMIKQPLTPQADIYSNKCSAYGPTVPKLSKKKIAAFIMLPVLGVLAFKFRKTCLNPFKILKSFFKKTAPTALK